MGLGKRGKERVLLHSTAVLLIPTVTSAAVVSGLLCGGALGRETQTWRYLQTLHGQSCRD